MNKRIGTIRKRINGIKDAIRRYRPEWDGNLPDDLCRQPYITGLEKYLDRVRAQHLLQQAIRKALDE